MHSLEAQSATSRFRIGTPEVQEGFFPVPHKEPYILISGGSANSGGTYKYWEEVLFLLDGLPYRIYQIGGTDEEPLPVDLHLNGDLNLRQTFYLVRNAALVICGDTSFVHIASMYDIPLLSLYGATDPANTGPYWRDKSKQVILEPNREKFPPTFNHNDGFINQIMPEEVAMAAYRILDIALDPSNQTLRKTVYIGPKYSNKLVEFVPDHIISPNAFEGVLMSCRYDYGGEEKYVFENLKRRKLSIITNKELNLEMLRHLKPNINSVSYEVDMDTNVDYIKSLIRTGLNVNLFTKSDEVDKIRFKFLDVAFVMTLNKLERREELIDLSFKTNKILLSSGKVFGCKTAWLNGDELDRTNIGKVYDTEDFWNEQEHFLFFEL